MAITRAGQGDDRGANQRIPGRNGGFSVARKAIGELTKFSQILGCVLSRRASSQVAWLPRSVRSLARETQWNIADRNRLQIPGDAGARHWDGGDVFVK